MAGHRLDRFLGIQDHINAIWAGDTVEARLAIIAGSNSLTDDQKRWWPNFLQCFCMYGAIEPLLGTTVDLGDGVSLRLWKRHEDLQGNELPGARVGGEHGDIIMEGDFLRHGVVCDRVGTQGEPLWPLIIRNPPIYGAGPRENFRPQALELLKHIGLDWPIGGRRAA